MTVIFISELRRAGLCVKIVGLTQRLVQSANGIVIGVDLTLEQARLLASDVICIIVPATTLSSQQLKRDPRLATFLQQAQVNQAKFVISDLEIADLGLTSTNLDLLIVQAEGENLIRVARQFAASL